MAKDDLVTCPKCDGKSVVSDSRARPTDILTTIGSSFTRVEPAGTPKRGEPSVDCSYCRKSGQVTRRRERKWRKRHGLSFID